MSFPIRGSYVALLVSTALVSTARPHAAAQAVHPSLAGTWQLNEAKSEKYDPNRDRALGSTDATGATVATGMGRRTGGRSGGGSGGSGGSGSGGVGGSGGASGPDREVAAAMGEATRQPPTLRIEQNDSTITVSSGRRPLVVRPDGESLADSTLDGEVVYSVKAEWKKDQLVIEKHLVGGTSLRSTYYLDKKDPKVLIVDVRFESKTMRRTIDNRRVYNSQ